jgi:hypothetical protein
MTGPSVRSATVVKVGEAKKVCFVVGPMGEQDNLEQMHADWLVSEIIEPVIRELPGFVVKRADHHRRASPIDTQVMHYLLNSDLVIADLSSMNAYVFYDIAIRHISRKPIIHMHREGERLPFDPNLCESIGFSRLKPSDLRTARSHLRQLVDAVLDEGYEVVNPISHFFGRGQVTPISAGFAQKAGGRSQAPAMPQSAEPASDSRAEAPASQQTTHQEHPEAPRMVDPIASKAVGSQVHPMPIANAGTGRRERAAAAHQHETTVTATPGAEPASQPAPASDTTSLREDHLPAVELNDSAPINAAQPVADFILGAATVSVEPVLPRAALRPSAVAPPRSAIATAQLPRATEFKLTDQLTSGRMQPRLADYQAPPPPVKPDSSHADLAHKPPLETPGSATAGKPIKVSAEGLETIKARLEARLEEMQAFREGEPS